jgi:hypothetical protein
MEGHEGAMVSEVARQLGYGPWPPLPFAVQIHAR